MDRQADPEDVVSQLTLSEKASLTLGSDFWHTTGIPRLGIRAAALSDGPHGVRKQRTVGDHAGAGRSLPATCFPTASALGSSWDIDLVRTVGAALGAEARDQGVDVLLGPGLNIKRSPLCGRNFEYLSEDPLLTGRLATAMVTGIQSVGVGACAKHFAVNNQETDRLRVSADVDERTMREIYLSAFERVVKDARPWTVMAAYNRINGVYASENRLLLTEILRDEWGFDGLVVSDWGAVHDRPAAVAAGLDLEMPPHLGVSDQAIVAAVGSGALPESAVDRVTARVVRLSQRAERARSTSSDVTVDYDAHHALARTAAAESLVLLKNTDDALPLTPDAVRRVAVVGPFAIAPRYQGAGSSLVNSRRVDNPFEELRVLLPSVEFVHATGYLEGEEGADAGPAEEAVAVASGADATVVFLGLPDAAETEGVDRTHLELPTNQIRLLEQIAPLSGPTIVVLMNGGVVRTAEWDHMADAVLEAWLAGEAAGGAVADVLTGAVNPSGRLTETIPLRLEDTPAFLNFPGADGHVQYGEGIFVGYRGYDRRRMTVGYPFGHGLSYTTFEYEHLQVMPFDDVPGSIEVLVRNTGDRAGKEVVQIYAGRTDVRPGDVVRRLAGFTKMEVAPGESREVRVELDPRAFMTWSTLEHDWVHDGGAWVVSVGGSSRDIRLGRRVDVPDPATPTTLTADSTLQEWLSSSTGGPLLKAAVGREADGRSNGILDDERSMRVIGNFPLRRLPAFPRVAISDTIVSQLEAEIRRGQ